MDNTQINNLKWYDFLPRLKKVLKAMRDNTAYTKIDVSNTKVEQIITNGTPVLMMTVTNITDEVILPPVKGNEGRIIFIINTKSSSVKISSNNEIWEGGLNMSETSVSSGSGVRFVNDSQKWRTF